jgi:hypothetical protein
MARKSKADTDDSLKETRYQRVKRILNEASGDACPSYQGYERFWELPLEEFLRVTIYGVRMIAPPDVSTGTPGRPSASGAPLPVAREFEDYLETRADFYGRERRWEGSEFWRRRHGWITLDPRAVLCSEDSGDCLAALERLSMHMPASDLRLLYDLCRAPRPAHEVVSAFRDRQGGRTPDRRIILALQYLIEERVITTGRQGN